MPEKMPSLWMPPPSGGINVTPNQQHILDFSPLHNYLANKTKAASTKESKASDSKEPKLDDLRLGYARQLYDAYKGDTDKATEMENLYGVDVAHQLPEYKSILRHRDEVVASPYTLIAGKREKEKQDAHMSYIEKNGAMQLINLQAAAMGYGTRTNAEHLGEQEQGESTNFDPNTENALWKTDFPIAPSVATMTTARTEADALFNPAETKMNKIEWAHHMGDIVRGSAMGVMKEKGGSGNNWTQLNEAMVQAKDRLGISNDEQWDLSDPMVSGYMQGYIQRLKRKSDGNYYMSNGKLAINGDEFSWTQEAAKDFGKFVEDDIVSHNVKRKEEHLQYDESFDEYSETAYGRGLAVQEMAELVAPGLYQEGENYMNQEFVGFEDLMHATMTEEQKVQWALAGNYKMTPELAAITAKHLGTNGEAPKKFDTSGNVTKEWSAMHNEIRYAIVGNPEQGKPAMALELSEQGKLVRDNLNGLFDETFAIEGNLNGTVVPPMYQKDIVNGKIVYTPNLDSQSMEDRGALILKDGLTKDGKWKDSKSKEKWYLFQETKNKLQKSTMAATKTYALLSKMGNQYINEAGVTPELNKAIDASTPVGTRVEGLIGTTFKFGGDMYNGGGWLGEIVDNGSASNTLIALDAGFENWGRVKNTTQMKNQYKAGFDNGTMREEADGGVSFMTKDGKWRPFNQPVDHMGNVVVPGVSATSKQGSLRVAMTEEQMRDREAYAYYQSEQGNPEVHYMSPAQNYRQLTVGLKDNMELKENFQNKNFRKSVMSTVPKDAALRAVANAKVTVTKTGTSTITTNTPYGPVSNTQATYTYDIGTLPKGANAVTKADVDATMDELKLNKSNPSETELKLAIGTAIVKKQQSVPGKLTKVVIDANVWNNDKEGIDAIDPEAAKQFGLTINRNVTDKTSHGYYYRPMRSVTAEKANITQMAIGDEGNLGKIMDNSMRDMHGVVNGSQSDYSDAYTSQHASSGNKSQTTEDAKKAKAQQDAINLLNPLKGK